MKNVETKAQAPCALCRQKIKLAPNSTDLEDNHCYKKDSKTRSITVDCCGYYIWQKRYYNTV